MAKTVKSTTLSPAAWQKAAECLRALAHPQRLQIVKWLLTDRPLPVGELAELCGLSQSQTSEHLRLMQRCGFLQSVRQGREVFYEVCEPHLERIIECVVDRFGSATAR